MVCNSTEAWMAYKTYAQLPVVIGEWSLAVNYNENLRCAYGSSVSILL